MPRIRVVLAEDYPVVRLGIRQLLGCDPEIEIVGEAETGIEALRLVNEVCPDLLILDMELPGLDGIEVAKQLKTAKSPVKILVLSAYEEKEFVLSMLELGVSGYMLKDEAANSIGEAVHFVAKGERGWVSRRIAARISDWMKDGKKEKKALTRREKEILRLVVDGKTNYGIAQALNMSEKTIEKHITHIYLKLGVDSRTDAAVKAIRQNLLV